MEKRQAAAVAKLVKAPWDRRGWEVGGFFKGLGFRVYIGFRVEGLG